MKLSNQSLAALAMMLPTLAIASPVPEPAPGLLDPAECLPVTAVVKALKGCPSATPFCSSLLGITTVIESEIATITSPRTTTVVTTTIETTITPVITSYTTTSTTVTTCTATAGHIKRHHDPPAPCPDPAPEYPPPPHGGPVLPPCVSRFPLPDVSKGCSCLHLPTPTSRVCSTVTVTPTATCTSSVVITATAEPSTTVVTVTSSSTKYSCPAPTACSNQGLEWAYYENTSGDNKDGSYSSFVPQDYKTHKTVYEGLTSTIGGISIKDGSKTPIYGSPALPSTYFVLNHRGYIYAQQTGAYKLTFSGVDDTVYLWIGSPAYSGWTAANSRSHVTYNANGPGFGSHTTTLEAGQYYPVRIVYANAQGAAVFQLSVTAPDGTVFLSSGSAASPYLVRYSCDEVTAPKYGPFGSEI